MLVFWIGLAFAFVIYLVFVGACRGRPQLYALVFGLAIIVVIIVIRAMILSVAQGADAVGFRELPQDIRSGWFPHSWPHRIFFLAMLGSVLAAFILYARFPHYYTLLGINRTQITYYVINFLLPLLQGFLALGAVSVLDSFDVHMLLTLLYLAVFVVWDVLLFTRMRTCSVSVRRSTRRGHEGVGVGCASSNNTSELHDFHDEVKSYFWGIDVPTLFSFSLLFAFSLYFRFNPDAKPDFGRYESVNAYTHAFMAGVVASQAVAALVGSQVELWRRPQAEGSGATGARGGEEIQTPRESNRHSILSTPPSDSGQQTENKT